MIKLKYSIIFCIIAGCTLLFQLNTTYSDKKNNLSATKYLVENNKTTSYTGKGIKIAIIDSGVDITHPDLKNNISGGYDFVENKPIYKDGDERTGHGTHVSGIIAANGKMKGISKDASLLVYRVISNNNESLNNNIIKAIKKAIDDGAKIINLSLRISKDTTNRLVENTIKEAVDKGIVVVKSNGNYGPENWTTEDIAGSEYVISVGNSTYPTLQPIIESKDGTTLVELESANDEKSFTATDDELILDLGNISIEGLKNKDLNNRIVLLNSLNDYYIDDIIEAVKNKGIKGIIVANSNKNNWHIDMFFDKENSIPCAIVSGDNVLKLREIIKNNVKISNKEIEKVFYESSRGPIKGTLNLKPDIIAPGTHVLSTVPSELSENDSGYRKNTGTSMSAPYVTGAVALIKEAHPNWTPEQIKVAISNNASILKDGNEKSYSVLSQGSGRINIERALNTEVFITPNNLSFGVTSNSKENISLEKSLEIQNIDSNNKLYSISVEMENRSSNIKIDIPSSVKISANQTKNILIKVTVNAQCKPGVYCGRIYLEENNDKKVIPFIIPVMESEKIYNE